ncbi:DMT family transporter [Rhodovibrionaceae bacterium A322]
MSQSSVPALDLNGWILLFALAFVWAGAFYFTEIALEGFGPFTVVFGRVAVAAITLFVWITLRGKRLPGDLKTWGAFLIMGTLNNLIPFSLIVWGQTEIEAGLASILNATTPIFTVILAHFLTADERLTPGRFLGVLLGFAGVAILLGGPELFLSDDPVDGQARDWLFILAHFAVLGGACSYGFAGIFGRRFRGLDTEVSACSMLVASSSLALPLAFLVETPLSATPDLSAVLAVVITGVAGTAVAYLMYFSLLKRAGATNTLLVTFLIPPGALVLGIFLLDERPGLNAWIGMAVIFAGLLVIDGRLFRRQKTSVAAD